MIVRTPKGFRILSHQTGKPISREYALRKEAEARLEEIEHFKKLAREKRK